jgi:hypothetical protein
MKLRFILVDSKIELLNLNNPTKKKYPSNNIKSKKIISQY